MEINNRTPIEIQSWHQNGRWQNQRVPRSDPRGTQSSGGDLSGHNYLNVLKANSNARWQKLKRNAGNAEGVFEVIK